MLARDILNDPIKITQGNAGQVNEDVKQIVHIMDQGIFGLKALFYIHLENFGTKFG